MTNKPHDQNSDERADRGHATAVDYVRTQQEVDAAAEKRKAETKLAQVNPDESHAPASAKGQPRQHRTEETDEVQDSSDEPVVEDEP